jgi:hypothetical protein
MSFHGIHQPETCIRVSDIDVRNNCARGKCLPAAFFQGQREGRLTEREIDEQIALSMEYLISWADSTDQVCSHLYFLHLLTFSHR